MCGIAGILMRDPEAPASPSVVRAMRDALLHRGPDHQGSFVEGPVGLASTRLAIIDPEGGNQPIAADDGAYTIVFNGEIYNYRELRAELSAQGRKFRTATDTEVVLQAYAAWGGATCLERLSGMFAFAIWDAPRHRLFLARDRLGIKPLYLTERRDCIAFASEAKALLHLPDFRPECDADAVGEFLFCGYPLGKHSFFAGIESVLPGECVEIEASGVVRRRYWDVPFRPDAPGATADEDALLALLEDAVRRELHADVPIGSCLSGGLDSSVVSALAAKHLPGLRTFSIGYAHNTAVLARNPRRIVGEVVGDDAHFAAIMAEALGTAHQPYVLPVEPLLSDIDTMIRHREKPLITLSEYGHFRLCREAVRSVKVLLSGQGSDELFGGYYYWWRFKDAATTTFFPWVWRSDPNSASYPVTATDQLDTLLRPEFVAQTRYREAHQAVFDDLWSAACARDFLGKVSYLLIKTHLVEMLELEDRHSMASSLEIRVPYLDHRLVEWAVNLPSARKVPSTVEKHLLRSMARTRIPNFPAAVADRRKSPMPPPFDIAPVVSEMLAALRRPGLAIEAYFDRRRLDALLDTFHTDNLGLVGQRHYVLFPLYFLERWHAVFR